MKRVQHLLPLSFALTMLVLLILAGCAKTTIIPPRRAASPSSGSPHATLPACLNSATPPRCYSPQQIRAAYGIQPLLDAGITGKGRTIVVIVHNPHPDLKTELHLYDQLFGLSDPMFNILEPFGPVPPSASVEATLDIEIAHSIAPGAAIDLIAVDTHTMTTAAGYLSTFLNATKYAVDHDLGDVISQSFAAAESCLSASDIEKEHQIFQQARTKQITVLAASGDSGPAVTCSPGAPLVKSVSYPASDPLVTAVGGTTLDAAMKTGAYQDETAWTESQVKPGAKGSASGGGFSTAFARPHYQDGIANIGTSRGVPDVAFDADFSTGVPILVNRSGTVSVLSTGGTSAASPQWAGIVALTDQMAGRRLGFLNTALYHISQSPFARLAFHDVTSGNNSYTYTSTNDSSTTIQGYSASPGWDAVTGLGTPEVARLVPLLIQYTHPDDGSNL